MLTPATFRQNLPEFSDTAAYPDPLVQLQLDVAYKLLSEDRWGALLDTGAGWVAAHFLVISKGNARAASRGTAPGQVQGVTTAKAVDKVSKSMDVSRVTHEDVAFWNMTEYGVRFYEFAKMMGAGGIQL